MSDGNAIPRVTEESLARAYRTGYDNAFEEVSSAGEGEGNADGEGGVEEWGTHLLEGPLREAAEFLGLVAPRWEDEDDDEDDVDADNAAWVEAGIHDLVNAYVDGARAGAARAMAALRADERAHVYAVVGTPGGRRHLWERFPVADRAAAERWATTTRDAILRRGPTTTVDWRILPGEEAFEMRWPDGSRIYWTATPHEAVTA